MIPSPSPPPLPYQPACHSLLLINLVAAVAARLGMLLPLVGPLLIACGVCVVSVRLAPMTSAFLNIVQFYRFFHQRGRHLISHFN